MVGETPGLFPVELVLAEIRIRQESLERLKREGRPAADAVVSSLLPRLAARLPAEASRPPLDVSKARTNGRRTDAEVVPGVEAPLPERHADREIR